MDESEQGCRDFATEREWPNCSVPDCEFKSCLSLNSDKCYPHTMGRNPRCTFDEYMSGEKVP